MKTFKLHGSAVLFAEDIEDCFRRIGEYYLALSRGEDAETPFQSPTDLGIQPLDE